MITYVFSRYVTSIERLTISCDVSLSQDMLELLTNKGWALLTKIG